MIQLQVEGTRITVQVLGTFTLADYKEFEEAFIFSRKFQGPMNVLMDLRDMLSFSVDVAWEELRFTRQHAADIRRIAILTGSEWVTWSAWLNRLFVDAEIRVFDDTAMAEAWLAEGQGAAASA